MYLRFSFILLIIISCSNANQNEIFRSISISPDEEISLGEKFQQKEEIAVQVTPFVFELFDGSFGSASSITIFTDSLFQVDSISFQYSVDYDFDEGTTNYISVLGMPEKVINSDTLVLVIWKDERTTFQLGQEKNSAQNNIYSILKDNL
ncbi:hypothetical protein GYB29_05810 [bacterium]|jgi:hypothetical protein|nr:hypothetical protein [Balneola sp.]MBR9917194.1 hypothetical protein [bacterium]